MYEKVSFRAAEDYSSERVFKAVESVFRDINAHELLGSAKKVVIKPNLVIRRPPEACATTHPAVLAAVLRLLEPYDAEVIVAETPGGVFNESVLKALYRTTGAEKAATDGGASLNFDTSSRPVPSKLHEAAADFNILSAIADADLVINIAKLKTHTLTTLSAAVKNMFGAVPGLQKFEMHARFPDPECFCAMVVELTHTISPQINIVDGIYGMEGNGPNNGDRRFFGAVFGSRSPFCCDVVCREFLGLPRDGVPMLNEAARRGFCPANFSELELCGDTDRWEKLRVRDLKLPDTVNGSVITKLTHAFGGRLNRLFEPRPVVTRACVGCGECASYCPAGRIKVVNRRAVIDHDGCIRCFCCQELCKHNAIRIKRAGVLKL